MEYEKGGSLLDEIRNGKKYSKEEILRMIQDITSGLYYLHSKRLMHRDIKPHNILVSKGRRMKLCDLEFLKEIDHSKHSIAIGHPGYMAPEFDSKNGKYTEKIDIWCLGMTLLQILNRKGIDYLSNNRNKYLEEIKKIDKDLYYICEQCLKEIPEQRVSALKLNEYVNIQLKDFFAMKDFQYCFVTSSEGKILSSKYENILYKDFEAEIEKEIMKILKNDKPIGFFFEKYDIQKEKILLVRNSTVNNEILKETSSMIGEYLNIYPNSLNEYELVRKIKQEGDKFVFKMKSKKLTKKEFVLIEGFVLNEDRVFVGLENEVCSSLYSF